MLENQVAQLATSSHVSQQGLLPPQEKQPHESLNAITLRSGMNYNGPEMPIDEYVKDLVEDEEDEDVRVKTCRTKSRKLKKITQNVKSDQIL